jgi:coiled-coil domain-containing protein 12
MNCFIPYGLTKRWVRESSQVQSFAITKEKRMNFETFTRFWGVPSGITRAGLIFYKSRDIQRQTTAMSTASLDAAAAARKERLSQLKSLKRKQPSAAPGTSEEAADETAVARASSTSPPNKDGGTKDVSHLLSGRNFDIEERAPKMGFVSQPSAGQETVEEIAAKIAEETRKQRAEVEKEDKPLDLFNLQPKKPNWDLKRDVEKKMERLNQRTDIAIAKLIKARLDEQKTQKNGEVENVKPNLVTLVAEREKEGDELDGEVEED